MKTKDPSLFERAVKMNNDDGYVMYDQYLKNNQPWPLSPASSQTESSEELSDFDFDYEN